MAPPARMGVGQAVAARRGAPLVAGLARPTAMPRHRDEQVQQVVGGVDRDDRQQVAAVAHDEAERRDEQVDDAVADREQPRLGGRPGHHEADDAGQQMNDVVPAVDVERDQRAALRVVADAEARLDEEAEDADEHEHRAERQGIDLCEGLAFHCESPEVGGNRSGGQCAPTPGSGLIRRASRKCRNMITATIATGATSNSPSVQPAIRDLLRWGNVLTRSARLRRRTDHCRPTRRRVTYARRRVHEHRPHLLPVTEYRCPFDLCDGSGFVIDDATNTASDCRCRAQRVSRARARR